MTVPPPLLQLLGDAAARGRPALTLTFARIVEILGEMPADSWWHEQRGALRSTGYDATVDHDRGRGWVTFASAGAEPLPEESRTAVVDVRVTFQWTSDGATDAMAWIDGDAVPVDLSAESARSLAEIARRGRRDAAAPHGHGGGSGI